MKSNVTGKYLYRRGFHNNAPKKSGIFEPNGVQMVFSVFTPKNDHRKEKGKKFYQVPPPAIDAF